MARATPFVGHGDDAPVSGENTVSGESTFGFEELFFSRTDPAGVIKYGNSVFRRVSAYDWEDLLNKPHKIVRHPEMPRAVFWLLWKTLKDGEPIGAYLKNQTKDGRSYWVFALVTPVKDGYLSVQMRPSSEYFDIVQSIYEDLAGRERREEMTPADSAALFLEKLHEFGFEDYPSFMAAALGKELMSRDRHLGNTADSVVYKFDELLKVTRSFLNEAQAITVAYKENEIVPTNFRILASQLGQAGAAIAVISDNYSILSKDMHKLVEGFIASAQSVVDTINTSYFLTGAARMQREVMDIFKNEEMGANETGREREMDLLRRQQADYIDKTRRSLGDISAQCTGFCQTCVELERLATGLEVMRVVGKVECSNYLDVKDRVDNLLQELETFQKTVTGALKALTRMNVLIQQEADHLRLQSEKAA